MADALTKYQPPAKKDSLKKYRKGDGETLGALGRYILDPVAQYWRRQGMLARAGLDQAEQGAQQTQSGNVLAGTANRILGPVNYLASPLTALLPTSEEVEASDLPDWAKGPVSAVNNTAQIFMPGPGELGALGAAVKPAMFLGVMAKNADRAALDRAKMMTMDGADRGRVLRETGWFKDVDGHWKFETDDSMTKMTDAARERFVSGQTAEGRAADIFDHPQLYENYPQMADIPVRIEPGATGYSGQYAGGSITGEAGSSPEVRRLMLHELDHGVQGIEGFMRGATPSVFEDGAKYAYLRNPGESAFDAYYRVAGEVAARNTERRAALPGSMRRVIHPLDTADVPVQDQIGIVIKPAAQASAKPPSLGRGMAQLADDVTDAERAALKARFEAEVGQTGTGETPASRDQALRNLTEAPKPRGQITTQSYKETLEDGTTRWAPGTLRVNPPKQVFNSELTPADIQRLGLDPETYVHPKGITTASYKETYPDGTTRWVPGTLRTKRPPKR